MKPLGVDLNIYPAKGYSATLPVRDPERAYTVSLTDDEYKLVFSRLGDRLRIAGTAELSGYDLGLNEKRCQALVRRTLEIFPDVADPAKAQFWTGLRPATPSNVPYIGRSRSRTSISTPGTGRSAGRILAAPARCSPNRLRPAAGSVVGRGGLVLNLLVIARGL